MTQKDKELLLKDLCARLPYKVKCATKFGDSEVVNVDMEDSSIFVSCVEWVYSFKPYLRPMSSMTKEEKKMFSSMSSNSINCLHRLLSYSPEWYYLIYNEIDWLNAHHFDYRDLIERGLALEAPEGMYDLKD